MPHSDAGNLACRKVKKKKDDTEINWTQVMLLHMTTFLSGMHVYGVNPTLNKI